MTSLSRRDLLRVGLAGGAVLLSPSLLGRSAVVAAPRTAALGARDAYGTSRASRLFGGTALAHADLHNHTVLSSAGSSRPAEALASMRSAGLDVAALTDHATTNKLVDRDPHSLDEAGWQETGRAADAIDADPRFVAIRGFEWTSSRLGHLCTYGGRTWTDPVAVGAVDGSPNSMQRYYDWLLSDPGRSPGGGGADALASFNHPGREPGRFGQFVLRPDLVDRMVSLEVFNRDEDYLYEGTDSGLVSPVVQALDAGWRVGMVGVTDQHAPVHGQVRGLGRAGLYVEELSRAGVARARRARRSFATREVGLRLDVAAVPGRRALAVQWQARHHNYRRPQAPRSAVRMGSTLTHTAGPVTFLLDIDRGSSWSGRRLEVQVLQSGSPLPRILVSVPFQVPGVRQPVIAIEVPVERRNGSWVMVRVSDPSVPADRRATPEYARLGAAVAYASPFFLA